MVSRTTVLLLVVGVLGTLGASRAHADITSSLILFLRLNEGTGTSLTDDGSGGHTATLPGGSNTPTWTASCQYGNCLAFSTDDYVEVTDATDLSPTNGSGADTAFTITFWANITNIATTQGLVSKWLNTGAGTEWLLFLEGSSLYFALYGPDAATHVGRGVNLTAGAHQGQWIHIAATYSGTETASGVKLYINGTQVDQFDTTNGVYTGLSNTTTAVRLGSYNDANYFGGSLDQVKMFSRELTASDIAEDFGNGESGGEAGTVHNVANASQLTTAMSTAVAGDEIVLANGNYSGTFTTNNAGTAGAKITLRAQNAQQAILVGDNVCDRSHEGLVLADAYWVVKDLKFTQHGRAIRITANNTEVHHNILEGYREEGIRVEGGDSNSIHHNVIGYSDSCTNTDSPGIFVVTNADNNTIQDNIIIATGNDGYMCGGGGGCGGGAKFGYGIFVANDSDNTLIQGNLLLANGGKGILRLLSDGANSAGLTGTMVRDNMLFFGEGGSASDDCNDDGNSFINNLFYGNYFWNWYTKGNLNDSSTGHHVFSHNTAIATTLTRGNVGFITAFGGPANCNVSSNYKVANTLQNNLFYSDDTLNGGFDSRILLTLGGTSESASLQTKSHNLFWAPSATSTWITNYTYAGTDIHATGSAPLFGNLGTGDFSLQAGSPGKAAASDGTDIGITYNTSLKQAWSAAVMGLAAQENTGLTATTSTAFTVDSGRPYQVWFYLPNSPCAQSAEQFTIEGGTADLIRDITHLNSTTTGVWVQAGGPQRYITLGRHTSNDGTLNVAWQHTNCVEKVFIRSLFTATEAYALLANPAPTLAITTPTSAATYATAASPLATLAGTASADTTLVTWSNTRGGNGTATGTTAWSVTNIALQEGVNVLTVTATDAESQTGQATLAITYTPPPPVQGLRVVPYQTHFLE